MLWTHVLLLCAAAGKALTAAAPTPLEPYALTPLPLGTITATPHSWLSLALNKSATGFAGASGTFYRYTASTPWTGGPDSHEYSELHESAPYWLNYIVPLAWTTQSPALQEQAHAFVAHLLATQAEDGWLGPETTRQTRGLWARALLILGLSQYVDANANTDRAAEVVTALHRFARLANAMLKRKFEGLLPDAKFNDTFDPWGFGTRRAHELAFGLQWLYEHHPRGAEVQLRETMALCFDAATAAGTDWRTFFVPGAFPTSTEGVPGTFTHGVNIAQAFRYMATLYRATPDARLIVQTRDAAEMVFTHHGSPAGTIIADEHLGGRSPARGSETCMAVESAFSLSYLYRLFAERSYADRAERALFNAVPAALGGDGWSHQYVQQVNQPWSRNLTGTPYYNVNSAGNVFGLEPNFPCCTVNHPQAWPKYVAGSYATRGNDTVVAALLGPTRLAATTLRNGATVSITADTRYPFGDTITYRVHTTLPIKFAVRIPAWCTAPTLNARPATPDAVTGLATTRVPAGSSTLTLHLPAAIRIETRNTTSDTISVHRGALMYALDLGAVTATSAAPRNWSSPHDVLPASEVRAETRDWEIAPVDEGAWRVTVDPETLVFRSREEGGVDGGEGVGGVWERETTPVWMEGWGCNVAEEDWGVWEGTAAVPPRVSKCGEKVAVRFFPYGAAKLRMGEVPRVRLA
ncbi:hypothetical protein EDC01DRAFT_611808 [Geopyxis carbonaria]|nr:hypothetical protein EDC01DRAFT_611808 [Geopyxis carbonaria]